MSGTCAMAKKAKPLRECHLSRPVRPSAQTRSARLNADHRAPIVSPVLAAVKIVNSKARESACGPINTYVFQYLKATASVLSTNWCTDRHAILDIGSIRPRGQLNVAT
jgi:hypothetical protein